jgi:ketosteroid isomerase-like protein
MSQENVEVARALTDLWNRGERSLVAIAKYLDAAVELESPFSSVAGEPYRGHTGIEQWALDVDEQFTQWRVDLGEVTELDNALIALAVIHALGRASGIAVDFPAAFLTHFGDDHRITRIRIYWDVNEALKAVGLAE